MNSGIPAILTFGLIGATSATMAIAAEPTTTASAEPTADPIVLSSAEHDAAPAAQRAAAPATANAAEVVLRSDVTLQPLNPARGAASPRAGVLWGDIRQDVPTGAIIQFADGFSSPPHIHNITYRGVVMEGLVHNDDPDAETMWMGPGSFWIQPAGESHITAAAEGGATIFLEILEGPYLVQPPADAFVTPERPVNIDAYNIVWMDSEDSTWLARDGSSEAADSARMTFLWGSPEEGELNGTLFRLPAGENAALRSAGGDLRAVIIKGDTEHRLAGEAQVQSLEAGSYFGSRDGAEHQLSCESEQECLVYVRTEGKYDLVLPGDVS